MKIIIQLKLNQIIIILINPNIFHKPNNYDRQLQSKFKLNINKINSKILILVTQ